MSDYERLAQWAGYEQDASYEAALQEVENSSYFIDSARSISQICGLSVQDVLIYRAEDVKYMVEIVHRQTLDDNDIQRLLQSYSAIISRCIYTNSQIIHSRLREESAGAHDDYLATIESRLWNRFNFSATSDIPLPEQLTRYMQANFKLYAKYGTQTLPGKVKRVYLGDNEFDERTPEEILDAKAYRYMDMTDTGYGDTELQNDVATALEQLSPRQAAIIQYLMGGNGAEGLLERGLTQEEIEDARTAFAQAYGINEDTDTPPEDPVEEIKAMKGNEMRLTQLVSELRALMQDTPVDTLFPYLGTYPPTLRWAFLVYMKVIQPNRPRYAVSQEMGMTTNIFNKYVALAIRRLLDDIPVAIATGASPISVEDVSDTIASTRNVTPQSLRVMSINNVPHRSDSLTVRLLQMEETVDPLTLASLTPAQRSTYDILITPDYDGRYLTATEAISLGLLGSTNHVNNVINTIENPPTEIREMYFGAKYILLHPQDYKSFEITTAEAILDAINEGIPLTNNFQAIADKTKKHIGDTRNAIRIVLRPLGQGILQDPVRQAEVAQAEVHKSLDLASISIPEEILSAFMKGKDILKGARRISEIRGIPIDQVFENYSEDVTQYLEDTTALKADTATVTQYARLSRHYLSLVQRAFFQKLSNSAYRHMAHDLAAELVEHLLKDEVYSEDSVQGGLQQRHIIQRWFRSHQARRTQLNISSAIDGELREESKTKGNSLSELKTRLAQALHNKPFSTFTDAIQTLHPGVRWAILSYLQFINEGKSVQAQAAVKNLNTFTYVTYLQQAYTQLIAYTSEEQDQPNAEETDFTSSIEEAVRFKFIYFKGATQLVPLSDRLYQLHHLSDSDYEQIKHLVPPRAIEITKMAMQIVEHDTHRECAYSIPEVAAFFELSATPVGNSIRQVQEAVQGLRDEKTLYYFTTGHKVREGSSAHIIIQNAEKRPLWHLSALTPEQHRLYWLLATPDSEGRFLSPRALMDNGTCKGLSTITALADTLHSLPEEFEATYTGSQVVINNPEAYIPAAVTVAHALQDAYRQGIPLQRNAAYLAEQVGYHPVYINSLIRTVIREAGKGKIESSE